MMIALYDTLFILNIDTFLHWTKENVVAYMLTEMNHVKLTRSSLSRGKVFRWCALATGVLIMYY